MKLKNEVNTILYFVFLFFIITVSFLYYAPCNYFYFNSDHAIHVLMSKDFQLPRDYFYWGQNRLGSLLPLCSYVLSKFIPIHLLYICSIVQYVFLFTGFYLLSKWINNKFLKLALCALIFLPVNDYNALILIGHPYASQLFVGSLFVSCLGFLKRYLIRSSEFRIKQLIISLLIAVFASIFYIVGVWVSEFNAILILIPVLFILLDKKLKTIFINGFTNRWFLIFEIISLSFLIFISIQYYHIKSLFHPDAEYDKIFISTLPDIKKNVDFFLIKLQNTLLFKDSFFLENLFNWFLILITLSILIVRINKRKLIQIRQSLLINSLLAVCIASSFILFLSVWNLRSEFCPRYFTPVYIVFCFTLLLLLDSEYFKKTIRITISLLILFFCFSYCYKTLISKKPQTPFQLYGEFRTLPKGTLIGNYWDAYQINAVAIDNLQSLAFDSQFVRNNDWRDKPLNETNFYFLNNKNMLASGLKDTMAQFGIAFYYSGTNYNCNNTEVKLYYKVNGIKK